MQTIKKINSTGVFPVKFNVYSGGVITPHCLNINVSGFDQNNVDGNGMTIEVWMQSLLNRLVITVEDWSQRHETLQLFFDPLQVENVEIQYIIETIFNILNSLLPISQLEYETV